MNFLDRMSPERRRQVLIGTAAGGLLVVFLLARRRDAASAQLVPTMPSAAELGLGGGGGAGFDWEGTPVDDETPRLVRAMLSTLTDLTAKIGSASAPAPGPAPGPAPTVTASSSPTVIPSTSPAPEPQPPPRQPEPRFVEYAYGWEPVYSGPPPAPAVSSAEAPPATHHDPYVTFYEDPSKAPPVVAFGLRDAIY